MTNNGHVVAWVHEHFILRAEADHTAIVGLVRDRLPEQPLVLGEVTPTPTSRPTAPPGAARSRAEPDAAIVPQPQRRTGGKDGVGI